MDEARMQINRALSLLDNADMPLAAWRVHRAAGEIYSKLGEAAEAARQRVRFEQVIERLAGNFDTADRLRSSLLAALGAPACT
jgi:hypothetical protein